MALRDPNPALRGLDSNPNTTGTTSSTTIDRLSGDLGHVRLGGDHHHQQQPHQQQNNTMDDASRSEHHITLRAKCRADNSNSPVVDDHGCRRRRDDGKAGVEASGKSDGGGGAVSGVA